jgi:hypothetical protein
MRATAVHKNEDRSTQGVHIHLILDQPAQAIKARAHIGKATIQIKSTGRREV